MSDTNPMVLIKKVAAGLKGPSRWFQDMVCINKYKYVDGTPNNSKPLLTLLNNTPISIKKGGI